MTARQHPIGVFDSGIGGLTVVREIMHRLPSERFVYLGDTARVPYGPKSPDTVRRYSLEIAAWLRVQGAKAIVVACNTATAHALDVLRAGLTLPVIGVIEPGARAAVNASRHQRIGVIGTAGTIRSGTYERAIHRLAPRAQVTVQACPLFVPLVEEGWLDTPATRLIAREYLATLRDVHVDTLVLGCTHYPLLRPVIAEVMGTGVQLIDGAAETAAETERVLREHGLLADVHDATTPALRVVATDAPEQLRRLGEAFLGAPIDRVETHAFE